MYFYNFSIKVLIMKLSIYIIVLIGGSFLIYMRKNAEPIESSDSQSIRHNEQEIV